MKQKHTFLRLLTKLALLFPYVMIVVREVAGLIKFEASSAVRNLCTVIVFSVVFGGLLFCLWLGLLTLLVIHLISLHWTLQQSIALTLGINLTLLLVSGLLILRAKKKLLFKETRKRLFKKEKLPS
ncbi:MAG TPA: hypothetical protein VHA13_04485 [Gammaproteobacteria bacterium]|nr:hypothetical protein [Gammaproteobacteria bacterium]